MEFNTRALGEILREQREEHQEYIGTFSGIEKQLSDVRGTIGWHRKQG